MFDGEVAELDPCADGVDILLTFEKKLASLQKFRSTTLPHNQNWLLSLDGGSCSLV